MSEFNFDDVHGEATDIVEPEKVTESEYEGVSDLEPEPELDQTVTPPKSSTEKEEDIYATGKTWHEYPTYACPHCPFDSLERDKVVVHVQRIHDIPAKATHVSQLFDRFNNPIKVQDQKE